jgi:hypothetical protein
MALTLHPDGDALFGLIGDQDDVMVEVLLLLTNMHPSLWTGRCVMAAVGDGIDWLHQINIHSGHRLAAPDQYILWASLVAPIYILGIAWLHQTNIY